MDHGQLQGDPDPHIYIGQKVRIKVDALPGKIFNGEVTAISRRHRLKYSLVPTDNSAGNFVKVQQRIPVRWSGEIYRKKIRNI